MHHGVSRSCGLAWAAIIALSSWPAVAQVFPSRPITIIVPALPGGPADLPLRVIADKAAEELKQPLVILNRPGGGGGTVAAMSVKQAAPDGYTLISGSASTHAANKTLIPNFPYDPATDFQPISLLYTVYTILVVPGKSPATSVAGLVALAKSRPGGLFFVSPGIGTSSHLAGELLKTAAGIALVHVPQKSVPQGINEVVAERADFFFTTHVAAAPFVRDGRLRVLAITAPRRLKVLPEVPTMAEEGFPGIEIDTWFGLLAPVKTPESIVRRVHDAFVKAIDRPDVQAALTAQGVTPIGSSPAEFTAKIVNDTARFAKVIRESGARAE